MNYEAMMRRAATLVTMKPEPHWQLPDWQTLVNTALNDFSWDTELNTETATFMSVINQPDYTLPNPPDWKWLREVLYNAQPLYRSDEESERMYDPQWLTRPMATPLRFLSSNINSVRLCPTPGDIQQVIVRGVRCLPALVNPTDIPAVPVTFHEAIPIRAAWLYVASVGDADLIGKFDLLRQQYEGMVEACRRFLTALTKSSVTRRVKHRWPERINIGTMGGPYGR